MSVQKDDGRRQPRRPRGRPFEEGNPGRPPGSRNKSTAMWEMIRDEMPGLIATTLDGAKAGDPILLKLLLGKFLPKDRLVNLDLPDINSPQDAVRALSAVVKAVAAGEITPLEGAAISNLIGGLHRSLEAVDYEERIQDLEMMMGKLRDQP